MNAFVFADTQAALQLADELRFSANLTFLTKITESKNLKMSMHRYDCSKHLVRRRLWTWCSLQFVLLPQSRLRSCAMMNWSFLCLMLSKLRNYIATIRLSNRCKQFCVTLAQNSNEKSSLWFYEQRKVAKKSSPWMFWNLSTQYSSLRVYELAELLHNSRTAISHTVSQGMRMVGKWRALQWR